MGQGMILEWELGPMTSGIRRETGDANVWHISDVRIQASTIHCCFCSLRKLGSSHPLRQVSIDPLKHVYDDFRRIARQQRPCIFKLPQFYKALHIIRNNFNDGTGNCKITQSRLTIPSTLLQSNTIMKASYTSGANAGPMFRGWAEDSTIFSC